MKTIQGRNRKWNFPALAFAIPCVGMLFVMLISRFEPFGDYSMLYSDMYALGYANEHPLQRQRKSMDEIVEYRM